MSPSEAMPRTLRSCRNSGCRRASSPNSSEAGRGELRIVPRRRTDEPTPAAAMPFAQSSFRIVPMPRFLVNSELLLFPNRSR